VSGSLCRSVGDESRIYNFSLSPSSQYKTWRSRSRQKDNIRMDLKVMGMWIEIIWLKRFSTITGHSEHKPELRNHKDV
jgi:hypothetical protein